MCSLRAGRNRVNHSKILSEMQLCHSDLLLLHIFWRKPICDILVRVYMYRCVLCCVAVTYFLKILTSQQKNIENLTYITSEQRTIPPILWRVCIIFLLVLKTLTEKELLNMLEWDMGTPWVNTFLYIKAIFVTQYLSMNNQV